MDRVNIMEILRHFNRDGRAKREGMLSGYLHIHLHIGILITTLRYYMNSLVWRLKIIKVY